MINGKKAKNSTSISNNAVRRRMETFFIHKINLYFNFTISTTMGMSHTLCASVF